MYESRRDADNDYHEMHNCSISSSVVLMIGVTLRIANHQDFSDVTPTNAIHSGLALPIRLVALRWQRWDANVATVLSVDPVAPCLNQDNRVGLALIRY